MADEKKQEEAAPPAAPENSGGGGSKLVLILTALNTLLMVGITAVVMMSFMKEKNSSSVGDINPDAKSPEHAASGDAAVAGKSPDGGVGSDGQAADGKMVKLDQFTVNLSTVGSTRPRYLRVDVSLEVATSDTEAEVTRMMPRIRNTVIDLINSKKPTDVATPEGRNYLKDEIRSSINSFLVTGKLKGVYFTAFGLSS